MNSDRLLFMTLGTIIGSVATYILMRKHCEEYIHEELRLAKEHEHNRRNTVKDKTTEAPESKKESSFVALSNDTSQKIAKAAPPTDYGAYSKGKEERMTSLITSERFAIEEPDFEKISLSFYEKEGILADTYGDIVDIDSSIGMKAVSYFEMLHQDVIYIRNENLKIDYEIVLEHDSYYERYTEGFRDSD